MYHDTDIEVVYKCAKTQGFYFVRIVGASDFYSVLVFFLIIVLMLKIMKEVW